MLWLRVTPPGKLSGVEWWNRTEFIFRNGRLRRFTTWQGILHLHSPPKMSWSRGVGISYKILFFSSLSFYIISVISTMTASKKILRFVSQTVLSIRYHQTGIIQNKARKFNKIMIILSKCKYTIIKKMYLSSTMEMHGVLLWNHTRNVTTLK